MGKTNEQVIIFASKLQLLKSYLRQSRGSQEFIYYSTQFCD